MASFGILFTLQVAQKLFIGPIWMFLGDAGDKLTLLVAVRVNRDFRLDWVCIKLESFFLLPFDVVNSA
jgi:hypothetical protein